MKIDNKGLSQHFSLWELYASTTAEERGINNYPPAKVIDNLVTLAVLVLEPVRRIIDRPLRISSGYRCPELNKIVGGVSNSFHLDGRACDIIVKGQEEAQSLAKLFAKQPLCDLALIETQGSSLWLHVQFNKVNPRHRVSTLSK